jgi:hypothetical protein
MVRRLPTENMVMAWIEAAAVIEPLVR